jgi:lipoprotein-releasing system ATP-binding protein
MTTKQEKWVLKAEKINKFFYSPVEFHALKDVDVRIGESEFVALIGKSGCGKSTLLYILSTMDTQYQGNLYIKDQLLTGREANFLAHFRNAHIGFVFQFHYLLPEFSVLQNVMLPALKLGLYTRAEIEERAYTKLALLGVKEQALKRASQLSGGQQQRVAIARALINDPAIIMGDEPTGNLDSNNTKIVFDIFKELTTEYKQTIIAVTHDDEFARNADRIIEMLDGRIVSPS